MNGQKQKTSGINTKTVPAPPDTLVQAPKPNIEPDIDPMDTVQMRVSKDAIDQKVLYEARDSMVYDGVEKVFHLHGEAKVTQDDIKLEASYIKVDLNHNLVTAKGTLDSAGNPVGKPLFTQAGTEYRADVIKYNMKTKKGYLSEFRTKEGEGYIHGDDVVKNTDNTFGIEDAKYTTCNLDTPHYHIAATRIKVIPEKKIVTGPANLQIEQIPTPLVLPFGIFSIKRGQSSGVIVPTYGNSADRGYFLRDGGYYFGLGERADYRLTGSFYSNTSWMLNNGLRYASRYHFAGDLGFSYADNKFGEESDPNFTRSRDFFVTWNHRTDPKSRPGQQFTASVNIASVNPQGSSYLQNNSYNPNNIITNQLNSSINYNRSFKNGKYNLATTASVSQNTQSRDIAITLPDITFSIPSFNPFKSNRKASPDKWFENISTNYQLVFRNTINTKDSILFGQVSSDNFRSFYDTAGRFGAVHVLPVQTSFKVFNYYTLSMGVDMREYWYWQTIRKDTTEGVVRNQSVRGFERAFTQSSRVGISTRYYGQKNFGSGKVTAIRHVITPTLDFTYTPDYADPSRGYYRTFTNRAGQEQRYSIFERGIVGGPTAGRQGNIGFGLDNNLEMKVKRGKDTAEKVEKVQLFESFLVNSAYNIFADSLALLPVRFAARTRLFKNVMVNASAVMDPYVNQITGAEGSKTVTRINTFYWSQDNKLGIFTTGDFGVSASFNKETFKRKQAKDEAFEGDLRYVNDNPEDYYDFDVPWNLTVNYNLRYNRYQNLNNPNAGNTLQTINFAGDLNITSNWKIGYTSGYDIRNKQITFTSIDFIRLLHCWEFKLNWIPIGPRQSFLFTINVKSSLLQDLRMTRRRDWFDRRI
ncbi:MAG: hypothetical protein MUE96_08750 [Bacteroidia bacterium]|nr:hypothetical protein [Bacteroidia bacterium]